LGKGNADAFEVSLTAHLPTVAGANTGRLLSLSLLPQTHLPPPFQPPRSRVFQCFHYFKDRLTSEKKPVGFFFFFENAKYYELRVVAQLPFLLE